MALVAPAATLGSVHVTAAISSSRPAAVSDLTALQHQARRRVGWAGSLVFVAMGIVASGWGPLLPRFETKFHLSSAASGLALSAFSVGAFLGILGAGEIERRGVGPRIRIVGVVVLLALGSLFVGFAQQWSQVLAATAALGLGYGACTMGWNGMLSGWHGAGMLLHALSAAWGLGAIGGQVLVWTIPGVSSSFIVGGTLALLASAIAFRAPFDAAENDRPDATSDQRNDEFVESERVPLGRVGAFVVLFACYVATEVSATSWAPSHLAALGPGSWAGVLFWIGLLVGRLVATFVAHRWAPIRLIVLCISSAIFFAMLARVDVLAVVAWFGVGVACAPMFPSMLIWLQSRGPVGPRVLAAVLALASVGPLLGPPGVGWLVDRAGHRTIPFGIAGLAALTLAVTAAVWRAYPQQRSKSLA